jgi:histidinol-phosphate aminotransferase
LQLSGTLAFSLFLLRRTDLQLDSLGIAITSPALAQILNNIKAPYSVSTPTAFLASRALSPSGLSLFKQNISTLVANRSTLATDLLALKNEKGRAGVVQILGGGHANFLVVQIGNKDGEADNDLAKKAYLYLAETDKVVVRFRGNEVGCIACLRITVGTREECDRVVERLRTFLEKQ